MIVDTIVMQTAAEEMATIASAIGSAGAVAAGPTTGVATAAADEVSLAVAELFSGFGQECQAILRQAAEFHDELTDTLIAASGSYLSAELSNAASTAAAAAATSPLTGTSVGLVVGGTWQPIPTDQYVMGALRYVNENFTVLSSNVRALVTPAQAYPLTGVKTLTFDSSASQGLQILDNAIKQQLAADPSSSVAVLGYSQSAAIASMEMRNLADPLLNPDPPRADQLGFTLLGNPMNPNGGLFARFAGLNLPSMGMSFPGATPSDTRYPTHIYTIEYDGFADFPQYPINLIADLNAVAGLYYAHPIYADLDPAALPTGYSIQELPTSPGYVGNTSYYMITGPNLPLLEPLRTIPVIGTPLADLLQPNLTTIVNLGYGSLDQGWSTGYADTPTEFGVLPQVSPVALAGHLVSGTQQGLNAFATDIAALSPNLAGASGALTSLTTTGAPDALPSTLSPTWLTGLTADSVIQAVQTANSTITDSMVTAFSKSYSLLLPTADIATAMLTSVPSYDLNLVLDGVRQVLDGDPIGGLQYALLAPVAANTAIFTLAGGFELIAITWTLRYT